MTTEDFDQLWFVASQWGVGSYQEVVRSARAEICRRGTDTVDFVLAKLPYEGGMQFRTLTMYFKALGDDASAPLRKLLQSGDKALSQMPST
ncbi:MAG: hypothetical protein U5N86_06115 [Planctomycetota bacterium]|nr:hypothetical protein [Planctomycetota bacterium]